MIDTGERIYVNDANLGYFSVWKRTTQPGVVTFGDNGGDINDSTMYFVFYKPSKLYVDVKVFLQGPYNTASGYMKTDLRNLPDFPKNQPYNGTPWNYKGTETVSTIPLDVVDWVLVELRTGTSSSSFTAARVGFLKRDGTIVDMDGKNPVSFNGISGESYYIIIRHRNHLAIMSSNKVSKINNIFTYDFTTGQSKVYGINAMYYLGEGKYALYAGDINQDKQITTTDYTLWYNSAFNGESGYKVADCNLDKQVTTTDYTLWYNNAFLGISSKVP